MSKIEMLQQTELAIDPEFEKLISPLSDEEYRQLEENIEQNGCLHPIVIWYDTIVDGHNRYHICRKLGIPFETKSLSFNDREEVELWIIQHQLGRRNLQPYQRAELALKMKEAISEKAKENQRLAGGAVPQNSAKAVDTREELSKIAGVSHDTFSKAEKISSEASEEEKEKLRSGEASINSVYNKLKNKEVPPDKQQSEEDKARCLTQKVCHGIGDLVYMSHIPEDCINRLGDAAEFLKDVLSKHQLQKCRAA